MSRLDEMITEMCPDGVPYRPVAAEFTRLRGTAITAGKMSEIQDNDGPITIYAGGKTRVSAFEDDIPHANIVKVPSVLIQSRGIIDTRFIDYPFTFKNEMWAYTSDVTTKVKFLHYYLQAHIDHFRRLASKMGSLPQISGNDTDRYLIPIPPLPVQEEIVRTLDTFTALETELEAKLQAELDARKKQYQYYRLVMLRSDSNSPMIKIRDLGKWTGGSTPSMDHREFWDSGDIPWISSKDMKRSVLDDTNDHITQTALEETSLKLLPPNSIALVARSGILKHTLPVAYVPFATTVNQDIKALTADSNLSKKYVYHVLSAFAPHIRKIAKKQGGTVDSLEWNTVLNLEVPVPSIHEQERIADALDRFDELTHDLTSGLPAEIAARRKQYAYYRDKLLTFPRKNV